MSGSAYARTGATGERGVPEEQLLDELGTLDVWATDVADVPTGPDYLRSRL
jgi:hypothetical protein